MTLQHTVMPTPQRRGYRITDAAAYLGVSRPTINGLIKTGQLPAVHVGGLILIAVEELDRILREGATTPQPKRSEDRRRPGRPRLGEV
jgi:excisionase family DNA binding protein